MNASPSDVPELVYRFLNYLDTHGEPRGILAVTDLPTELRDNDALRLVQKTYAFVRLDNHTRDPRSNGVLSLILEDSGKDALAHWRLQPKRESDLPDPPADGVPSTAEHVVLPLSQADFDATFRVVKDLLYIASELHRLVLEEPSKGRTTRFKKMLQNLYQHLCSYYAPFDPPVGQGPRIAETQKRVADALIAIRGGANNSPVTQAFRYVDSVWRSVWGSTEREPIFMTVRKLSGSELKRALKALDGKGRDLLRALEPMDYDLQVDQMQTEVCTVGERHEMRSEAVAGALSEALRRLGKSQQQSTKADELPAEKLETTPVEKTTTTTPAKKKKKSAKKKTPRKRKWEFLEDYIRKDWPAEEDNLEIAKAARKRFSNHPLCRQITSAKVKEVKGNMKRRQK